MSYPAQLDIANCGKGPAQGGIAIADLKALATKLGIDITGKKKADLCLEVAEVLSQATTTVASNKKSPAMIKPKSSSNKNITVKLDQDLITLFICGSGTYGLRQSIKDILNATWDPVRKCWFLKYSDDNLKNLVAFFNIDDDTFLALLDGNLVNVAAPVIIPTAPAAPVAKTTKKSIPIKISLKKPTVVATITEEPAKPKIGLTKKSPPKATTGTSKYNQVTLEPDTDSVNIYICGTGTYGIKEDIKKNLTKIWDPSKKCWAIGWDNNSINKLQSFFRLNQTDLDSLINGKSVILSSTAAKKEKPSLQSTEVKNAIRGIHPLSLYVKRSPDGKTFFVWHPPYTMAPFFRALNGRWNPSQERWILPISALDNFIETLKMPAYWVKESEPGQSWDIGNIDHLKDIMESKPIIDDYDDQLSIVTGWEPREHNAIIGKTVIVAWHGPKNVTPDPVAVFLKANNWEPHFSGTVTKLIHPYYQVHFDGTE